MLEFSLKVNQSSLSNCQTVFQLLLGSTFHLLSTLMEVRPSLMSFKLRSTQRFLNFNQLQVWFVEYYIPMPTGELLIPLSTLLLEFQDIQFGSLPIIFLTTVFLTTVFFRKLTILLSRIVMWLPWVNSSMELNQ